MIHITPKEQITNYYNSPALGQSTLKKLLGDLSSFNKVEDSTKEHFVIGSAVDGILLGYPGQFEAEYYVSALDKTPSETVVGIIKAVHNRVQEDYAEYLTVVDPVQFKEDHFVVEQDTLDAVPQSTFEEFAGDLFNHEAYILEACEIAEYQPKYKPETKVKAIIEGGEKDGNIGDLYFKDLCKAFGKTVINATQHTTITSIVNSLRTNPRTARFFEQDSYDDLSNVDVYYQLPIYFTYRGIACKALLDMVFVVKDFDGNIVSIQPIDLKTAYDNTFYFINSVRQRRYDIQAAWYTMALAHHFNLLQSNKQNLIQNFIFVVESTTRQRKPLAYTVTDSLLHMGKFGRKAVSLIETDLLDQNPEVAATQLHKPILGYEALMDKFIWHSENGFNVEREIAEQPTEVPLTLDWDGIVTPLL